MNKLREELSAAVALTNLAVQSMGSQMRPQALPPLDVLEEQRRITLSNRLNFERSLAAAVVMAQKKQQQESAVTTRPDLTISRGPKRNFAQKLFDLLQNGLHLDIIRWIPGGRAFMVLDKRRFASEILPNYFKESQYTSFTRKLSRWKFTRVSKGPYMGAYYHNKFRSDDRSLCKLMSCNNSKLNKNDDNNQEGEAQGKVDDMEVENIIKNSLKDADRAPSTKANEVITKIDQPIPTASRKSPEATRNVDKSTPGDLKKHDILDQVTALETTMDNTNHNILLIKKQLFEIRLRKVQVEEKKHLLMMQAAQARRMKEIDRLRNSLNSSIQQTESNLIAAAAAAGVLNSSHRPPHQGGIRQRALYKTGSFPASWSPSQQRPQQDMSFGSIPQVVLEKQRMLLHNAGKNIVHQLRNHESRTKAAQSSRAFAA